MDISVAAETFTLGFSFRNGLISGIWIEIDCTISSLLFSSKGKGVRQSEQNVVFQFDPIEKYAHYVSLNYLIVIIFIWPEAI